MGNQMKKLLLLPLALLLVLICGQAYPPASSGSATVPDPLTLGGGIVSADGGVFTGTTRFQGNYPADGGAVEIQGGLFVRGDGGYRPLTVGERFTGDNFNILLNGSTGITGISWAGVGTMQYTNFSGWLLNDSFNGTKFTASAASGSSYTNTAGAYPQIMKVAAGAPAGADCDAAGEAGRQYYDSTANQMFVCVGAGGWKSVLYPL